MLQRFALVSMIAAFATLFGCASMNGPQATATLQPTTGNTASGSVKFTASGSRVAVSGEVRGLKPNAEHGFHVHEKGDCNSPDGMSAGGHFNPDTKPHGRHGAGAQHAGDLQSLKADANGVAKFAYDTDRLAVGSGTNDVLGRALIVHRDPDDFTTQPTGNSGARIACAVISKS